MYVQTKSDDFDPFSQKILLKNDKTNSFLIPDKF